MKKMTLLTALILSPWSFAEQMLLSHNFIQVGATQIEFADIPQFTAQGFEAIASKRLGDDFFAEGTYFDTKDNKYGEEFTADKWEASIGYIQSISSTTHIDYQLGYGEIDLGLSNGVDSISTGTEYLMLETNARHMFTQDWEVFAGLEWQFWREGSDQKAYHLGAQKYWGSIVGGVKYTKYSDSEIFGIYGRYVF